MDKSFILALLLATGAIAQNRPPLEFEVASIKPNNVRPGRDGYGGGYCRGTDTKPGTYPRMAAPTPLGQCLFTSVNLTYLIRVAYEEELGFATPSAEMVKGVPNWINSEFFNVTAKANDPSATTEEMLHQMLQGLLADRFKLKAHLARREMQGYGLYVSKNGPRLPVSKGDQVPRMFGAYSGDPDLFLTVGENASMRQLAISLMNFGIGPVLDKTSLQGRYDFKVTFDRQIITAGKAATIQGLSTQPGGSSHPTLFAALEDQLGLRLVRERVPTQYLVIDSVERPSEN